MNIKTPDRFQLLKNEDGWILRGQNWPGAFILIYDTKFLLVAIPYGLEK